MMLGERKRGMLFDIIILKLVFLRFFILIVFLCFFLCLWCFLWDLMENLMLLFLLLFVWWKWVKKFVFVFEVFMLLCCFKESNILFEEVWICVGEFVFFLINGGLDEKVGWDSKEMFLLEDILFGLLVDRIVRVWWEWFFGVINNFWFINLLCVFLFKVVVVGCLEIVGFVYRDLCIFCKLWIFGWIWGFFVYVVLVWLVL